VPQARRPAAVAVGGIPGSGMPPGLHWLSACVFGSFPGTEATSAIVTDVDVADVSVLLIKSFVTERELSPSGVTRQEQQAISSSCGSNV
jgi:hypothetical protein